MGRGRAKAKQTKVARELKYSTGSLDPDALRRELAANTGGGLSTRATDGEHDDEDEDDADED
ncbi:MAG: DUF3073 domain-containing protein [Mycobacteriales bacterium]